MFIVFTSDELKTLEKYRHVVASIMNTSMGNLTVNEALALIDNYKKGEAVDIKWVKKNVNLRKINDVEFCKEAIKIGFKNRHLPYGYYKEFLFGVNGYFNLDSDCVDWFEEFRTAVSHG